MRWIFLLVIASLLSGCADDRLKSELAQTQAELAQAKMALATGKAERAAELAYFERQAAIATACDYLISVCPSNLTAPGRAAVSAGHGGGDTWVFWTFIAAKLVVLAVALSSFVGCLWCWSVVWVAPGKEEVATANAKIAESMRQRKEMQTFLDQAHEKVKRFSEAEFSLMSRIADLKAEMEQCEYDRDVIREELVDLKDQFKSQQEAMKTDTSMLIASAFSKKR